MSIFKELGSKKDYATWLKQFGDFSKYPVGTRVRIKKCCEDFTFFRGNEIGTVVRNSGDYLGVIVQFSNVRFGDGTQDTWNFNPCNIELWDDTQVQEVEELVNKLESAEDLMEKMDKVNW